MKRRKAKSSPKAQSFMHHHIKHHMEDLGMSQAQAVAVAYSEARGMGLKVGSIYKKHR
jgi:UDP-N-acetylmuramyl pentapeptide phosphotransferase/UDP-N-acetylglucosamine-1-phosphate transferase